VVLHAEIAPNHDSIEDGRPVEWWLYNLNNLARQIAVLSSEHVFDLAFGISYL